MEMVVMPVPRADIAQIGAVARFIIAHPDLRAWKDENPRNTRVAGGGADNAPMIFRPLAIHISATRAAHGD